ncbi:sialate O-acetylesterase [Fulvivirga sp. 29W222]|uniref:Sialate O-acetylesterase n=1 Tax=Fulvivirga marina TaxID=2494733 RepID=A0A937FXH5_9BACT|nr:sialate O-acetylesterase [Fulvivirga marina]MBL6447924.1 sialate O-acetylesterase [Fulvivirga marina]
MNKIIYYTLILLFVATGTSFSNVSLPSVFADHMVLQQNAEVKLWGWGNPMEEITVTTSWDSVEVKTKADRHANWQVLLKTPLAGGPYSITIKGYNQVTLNDVLIGEVWLCSGQSNMEWTPSAGITNGEEAIKNANFPEIRFFNVVKNSADSPQLDLKGEWQVCTPNTMQYSSAVAYFFGKKLHENLDVPIGLVNSSWGGTPAETWIPQNVINADQTLKKASQKLKAETWCPSEPGRTYNAMIAPLVGFKLAGIIWYQGETNTANPDTYQHTFTALIRSWRDNWTQQLPFYYAQIAPYEYGSPESGVKVREAQRRTLVVPNTGMVMTSDICTTDDIHPRNKLDVGLRFANIALKNHYHTVQGIVEGPLLDSVSFKGKKAYVYFKHAEGLYLKNKDHLFEVAGVDKVFYAAKGTLKKSMFIVTSDRVSEPKYVRYAWGNTSISNIFNKANLPASSFTTETSE